LSYDGDFRGLLNLSRQSLALSLKEISLVIGPAFAAAIPTCCMIAYPGNTYGYDRPAVGALVPVRVEPREAVVRWSSPPVHGSGGVWRIRWPEPGNQLQLSSPEGLRLAAFPLRKPNPVIGKFVWWNIFFGNPAGYVPRRAAVSAIELELAPRQFLSVGPQWARGWEPIFFVCAGILALVLRKVLAVH
jgi:hypothetical protein